MNPYYETEQCGLEMLEFNQPNMCYEFNTLCFWATAEGLIFSASDSGCSCPTPFENYCGETQTEIVQKLERVGSVTQAESIFDAWNKDFDGRPYLAISERQKLADWLKEKAKFA